MEILWGIAIAVFGIVEVCTVALISIWFAVGAVVALVLALLDVSVIIQVIAFVVVSVVVLLVVRPYVIKAVKTTKRPTNADRVIGMMGLVTEDIDNIAGQGAVKVDGKVWTARSAGGEKLAVGTCIKPVSIYGVKLIVEQVSESDPENT